MKYERKFKKSKKKRYDTTIGSKLFGNKSYILSEDRTELIKRYIQEVVENDKRVRFDRT